MVVSLFKVSPPEGATLLRLNFDILSHGLKSMPIRLVLTAVLLRKALPKACSQPELQETRVFFIFDIMS